MPRARTAATRARRPSSPPRSAGDPGGVDDVVAVVAARTGLEQRRGVHRARPRARRGRARAPRPAAASSPRRTGCGRSRTGSRSRLRALCPLQHDDRAGRHRALRPARDARRVGRHHTGPGGQREHLADRGVHDDRPPRAVLRRREGDLDVFVMGVEAQQERVVRDRLAAAVDLGDAVAVEEHRDALAEAGVPVLLGHLLPGRGEPRDVRQGREALGAAAAADRLTREEPAPAEFPGGWGISSKRGMNLS